MTLEAFIEKRWSAANLEIVRHVNELLDSFREDEVEQATLRTVYYGLVKQNLIANETRMYAKLGDIVSDARMCGLIDWDSIVDLGRQPQMRNQYDDLRELMDVSIADYRLPRWEGQDNYVEVWVEKEGMTVEVAPVTEKWHVHLVPQKGYGSMTALYAASKRLLEGQEDGKACHILYMGDHDPSGLDMDRDIADRLSIFGVDDVVVDRIALTTEQVREYDPPENPAKMKDPRAKAYVARFGRVSWEVNALPVRVRNRLLEARIKRLVNKRLMDEVIAREQRHKARLREAVREIEEGDDD